MSSVLRLPVACLLVLPTACGGTAQPSPTSTAVGSVVTTRPAAASPSVVVAASAGPSRPPSPPAAAGSQGPLTAAGAQPSPTDDWLTYQHDAARSGVASGSYDPAST